MRISNLVRYTLWGGILATANANRRYYRMATTWAPHLLTNTLALLLPDLIRLLPSYDPHTKETHPREASPWWQLSEIGTAVLHDNPRYVAYTAPLAIGYLLSHPRFNIYKGELAKLRCGGFGLDAFPHAATAFGLVGLVSDLLDEVSTRVDDNGFASHILQGCTQHRAVTGLLVLGLATLLWEVGEYRIHCYEMAQRGDPQAINMQWSPTDTIYDCAANGIGWALHLLWRQIGRF